MHCLLYYSIRISMVYRSVGCTQLNLVLFIVHTYVFIIDLYLDTLVRSLSLP